VAEDRDPNIQEARRRRVTPKPAPRPIGVRVRRWLRRALRPVRRLIKSIRGATRRGYKGVERPPRWHHARPSIAVARLVTYGGAIVLAALVIRSLVIVFGGSAGHFPFGFDPDRGCDDIGYSCGVANSIVMSALTLAFATAAFVFLRLRRVRAPYVKRARTETRELVPTAGTIIGEIVGRDEVCNVIMDDLRERSGRRPHVVLGGVGSGKTAVLYQLTRLLAENGAVPVPIRLRDAQTGMDFGTLAKERFIAQATGASISDAEAERVWRELCRDDQIVVLADGLEEALSDDGDGADGDGGVVDSTERDNKIRLAIRDAQRNEMPLIIASRPHEALVGVNAAVVELEELGEEAALEYIEGASAHDAHRLDWVIETAEVTETPLFLQIAHELHEQHLLEHARQPHTEGLLDNRSLDRIGLRVALLRTWTQGLIDGHFEPQLPMAPRIRAVTVDQLALLACLGLKDDRLDVPFGRLLEKGGADDPFGRRYGPLIEKLEKAIAEANEDTIAGTGRIKAKIKREVRLAATRGLQLRLVEPLGDGVRFPHSILQAYLGSRAIGGVMRCDTDYLPKALKKASRELLVALTMFSRSRAPEYDDLLQPICGQLRDAASDADLPTAKRIDTRIAALEVDCVDAVPSHRAIAGELRDHWPVASEDRTVEESKLKAIARFGQSARMIGKHRDKQARDPAYRELFDIARSDLSYRVRLAAAQELAVGGDLAFKALASECLAPGAAQGWERDEGMHRDLALRAWLAPMLVRETEECASAARENLSTWLERIRPATSGGPRSLPLSIEIALCQGFKHAANRRPRYPQDAVQARAYLNEQATEMIKHTRFWFSRLTLVHALSLWALSEMPDRDEKPVPREPARRASDAKALVEHWLLSSTRGAEHPFVDEARDLAVLALEKRQPERFLWIDESGVVTKIGARPPRADVVRKHSLWIPSSVGWSALHPRAQKLVADVLLLLNLIERDGLPIDREQRTQRAMRDDLPPCLAREREYLDPSHTVGMVTQPAAGASCKDECPFDLCPYPPKGKQPYRVELSEAFCRRQRVLLGKWWRPFPRRTAPWQGALPSELKRFWETMEERARR
jgi:NACHT domain